MTALFPLPPGLVAVTGDEHTGKTTCLRRIADDASADALWLDLSLPAHAQEDHPQHVWDALQGRSPRWNAALHADLVKVLGLTEHAHKHLFQLSTGSRRKVALAGLLAAGATITCLDQPYAALDAASIRVLREFLRDMADHQTRTWVVADYEADPALPWARILRLPFAAA